MNQYPCDLVGHRFYDNGFGQMRCRRCGAPPPKPIPATGIVLGLLFVLLWAMTASAAPLTTCLSLSALPPSFTFESATHIEVGVWHEQDAGCDPTGERARPTAGPYSVQYFATGAELLTFTAAGFETCGRSQADVRWRGADGELYRYLDFIVDAGANCRQTGPSAASGGSGLIPFMPPPRDGPTVLRVPDGPERPPGGDDPLCPDCGLDPHSVVPVPEPASLLLLGTGLLYLRRRLR